MTDFGLAGVFERLRQLDDDLVALYGYSTRFEMVIVGGSALMLAGLTPQSRFTTDIDVLLSSAELEGLLERYDMNTDVSTFLYQYPANWNDRKIKISFDGHVLDVFTLSNEDLTITKLLAWRESDRQDLQNIRDNENIDPKKLFAILGDPIEVQANLDEEEWSSLLKNAKILFGGIRS